MMHLVCGLGRTLTPGLIVMSAIMALMKMSSQLNSLSTLERMDGSWM